MAPPKFQIKVPVTDLVSRFNDAFEEVNKHVVGRKDEIEAIKMGFLCGGNVLFEGPAGVAKSLLVRLCFKTIVGTDKESLVVFRKMFMPGTTPDEIFGPMSVKALRERDEIHFNTTGMLPEAHLAYCDELFRGSDSLLESTMGIFNEKTFHNGVKVQKCPLISAVATTNFVSDDPRLLAFNDRWLITHPVRPADNSNIRREILDLFLSDKDEDDIDIPEPISISELRRLQQLVRKVSLPDVHKELYEDMVTKYKKEVNDVYVSDRRYCQAARLIQAAIFLSGEGEEVEDPSAEHVTAARSAIIRSHNEEHINALDKVITEVVGSFEVIKKEEPEIAEYELKVKQMRGLYDANMSDAQKKKLFDKLDLVLKRVTQLSPDQTFTVSRNQDRFKRCLQKFEELKSQLALDLGM